MTAAPTGGVTPDQGRRVGVAVVGLSVLLVALAIPIGWPVLDEGPFLQIGWSLPWWLVAVAFALAESSVLHIQVRRDAQIVSVSELPLVVGLFLAAPWEVLVGRLLGSLLVFVVVRRSPALKIVFNTALFAVQTCLALSMFRLLAELTERSALQWLAALAATLAANALGAVLVAVVIWLHDDAVTLGPRLREAADSQLVVIGVTVLGLVAVNSLATSPHGPWLIGAAALTLILCYRAYASLFDQHVHLERLYQFSQSVTDTEDTDTILRLVLDETRDLLRGQHSKIVLVSTTTDPEAVAVSLDQQGNPCRTEPTLSRTLSWVHRLVLEEGRSLVLPRRSRDPAVVSWLAERHLRDAAVVPLRSREGIVGVLLVGDRLGDVRGFDAEDLLLLETLANHASIAVQKGELIQRLQHDALHDALTGLPNRSFLQRSLVSEVESCDARSPVAVMVLDLDGFKDVNDTLGHHQGDLALIAVAERLRRAVEPDGLVARLGGDEFAVLVPGAAGAQAAAVAERVVSALEEPVRLEDMPVELGASVGVALSPDHGTDGTALLKGADMAMYDAKSSGARIRFFEPARDTTSTRRLTMVSALRSALHDHDLDVVFQPQVDAASGRVRCFEALARWQHPELGSVSPVEFIPVAERSGLVRPLTAAVLQRSLTAVAEWGSGMSVAVNVSPRSLQDPDIVRDVQEALAVTGSCPESLVVEVTEGAVMTDPERATHLLQRFSDMGVRISIDDFGTGYSSLSYLKRLPLHEVKIDRSFVLGLAQSRQDLAIVRSVIELAMNLGLEVVAEGVEDLPTFDMLRSLGVTRAQGWFVGRPMPAFQVPDWLTEDATSLTAAVREPAGGWVAFP